MKLAAAQIACALGDVDANLRKIRDFSARAKEGGVELIVFPEMADTGYSMPVIQAHATPWTEGAVPELRKMAKSLSIAIICGVSERDGNSTYNSQVFIDGNGEIVGSYRKTHLFTGTPIGEDKCFSPGHELKSFPFGGFRLGLSICYDLRFPEVYRKLAIEQKANVFVISSAWPFPRVEHFRILCAARAIENQSYVIVSNRAGTDEGVTCCGSSAIIDPYGVTVASASTDREELIQAELSEEVITSVRNKMAVFEQRRPDLYGKY
ncbi:MAG TPA: nitrilase-related carbon-nitrogen hydrolase [Chthoniobacterales bacterium]|nr:nitrilase-related carbon-nitrogen hydrolase [Chthoniobacterales bacterium]